MGATRFWGFCRSFTRSDSRRGCGCRRCRAWAWCFIPNPLDAQVIGELVEKYKVTFLIATPTFLQGYMRRCTPESFGSLQYVLVGAEKLPERVALAFEDQFGIRPLEGYGCTECSPVVTVNGKDFRAPGFRQVAARARQDRASAAGRLGEGGGHRYGRSRWRRERRGCCW